MKILPVNNYQSNKNSQNVNFGSSLYLWLESENKLVRYSARKAQTLFKNNVSKEFMPEFISQLKFFKKVLKADNLGPNYAVSIEPTNSKKVKVKSPYGIDFMESTFAIASDTRKKLTDYALDIADEFREYPERFSIPQDNIFDSMRKLFSKVFRKQ